MENCCSEPPENTSSRPNNWLRFWFWLDDENRLFRFASSWFVSGTVICARTRKTSSIARVKRIFLRRSGIVQTLRSRSHNMGISFHELNTPYQQIGPYEL